MAHVNSRMGYLRRIQVLSIQRSCLRSRYFTAVRQWLFSFAENMDFGDGLFFA